MNQQDIAYAVAKLCTQKPLAMHYSSGICLEALFEPTRRAA